MHVLWILFLIFSFHRRFSFILLYSMSDSYSSFKERVRSKLRWTRSFPRPVRDLEASFGPEVALAVERAAEAEFRRAPERAESFMWKWGGILKRMQAHGERYSIGNSVEILEQGDTCFPAMLGSINDAQSRVWIQSYIWDASPVVEDFVDALIRAKNRGCDVCLIADYCGSMEFLSSTLATRLRDNRVDVVVFNPMFPHQPYVGPPCFRDHRKILIADEVGFCGSMNVHADTCTKAYIPQGQLGLPKPTPCGTGHFYDLNVKLEGPCVGDLADVFIDSLHAAQTGVSRSPIPRPAPVCPPDDPGCYVQVLDSNVPRNSRGIQRVLQKLIQESSREIIVTTSYFMPPTFLRRALFQAFRDRGVKGSLLLSAESDMMPLPGDLLGQTHNIRRFVDLKKKLRNGGGQENACDVFMHGNQHIHAKYFVFDRTISIIGSYNLDRYSARRNLECSVAVFSPTFAKKLAALHFDKVGHPSTIEASSDLWWYNSWGVRLACFACHCIYKYSSKNICDGFDFYKNEWHIRRQKLFRILDKNVALTVAAGQMWGLH